MTVKELIGILEDLPEDTIVMQEKDGKCREVTGEDVYFTADPVEGRGLQGDFVVFGAWVS